MNIEDLKKRKELVENNLKNLRDKIAQDTQNALRLEGALLDISEILADDEKKEKEEKEKKEDKVKVKK